jgi:hypothetical protein
VTRLLWIWVSRLCGIPAGLLVRGFLGRAHRASPDRLLPLLTPRQDRTWGSRSLGLPPASIPGRRGPVGWRSPGVVVRLGHAFTMSCTSASPVLKGPYGPPIRRSENLISSRRAARRGG